MVFFSLLSYTTIFDAIATPQIRVSVGKKNTIGDNFSPFGALLLALRAK